MKILWFGSLVVCLSASTLLSGCGKDEPQSVTTVSTPAVVQPVTQENSSEVSRSDTENASYEPAPQQKSDAGGTPKITMIKIEPVPAFPGSMLTALVTSEDPDGDLVTYNYQWLRNDEPVDGEFEEFDTAGFSKGDLIAVEVTPSDGEGVGAMRKSLPVLLHNRPPEITSFPTGMVDGRLIYQVEATDSDGDTLTYSLDGAPSGMEIGAESGLIDWEVPADLSGTFQIRILASDGDAKSYQTFSLTFAQQ